MKKNCLILLALIGIGFSANAQKLSNNLLACAETPSLTSVVDILAIEANVATERYINAKLCCFTASGLPYIYYKFSNNGRVEYYTYSWSLGQIVPNSEKYKYGSYYIDDNEYNNLIITWDNGATDRYRITWNNGNARMGDFFSCD